jgi:WD40 repeat protein
MECAAFGLEQQVRALCAVPHYSSAAAADASDVHRFLVGTSAFRGGNKLVLLEYKENNRIIEAVAEWLHDPEIHSVHASPVAAQAAIVHADATESSGTRLSIMQLDAPQTTDAEPQRLAVYSGRIGSVAWHPKGRDLAVLSADGDSLSLVNVAVAAGGVQKLDESASVKLPAAEPARPFSRPRLAWDPHHPDVLYVTRGAVISRVDTRQGKGAALFGGQGVVGAGAAVTSLDHNPNQMYTLMTGGTDGCVRLWDIRKAESSATEAMVTTVRAHDHTVTCASFNPFRDELILTASSDHSAKVWYEPRAGAEGSGNKPHSPKAAPKAAPALKKGVATSLPQCGEAVYAAAWSAAGPWVFAACSYSGKVLVDEVLKEHKMALLLAE